MNPASSLPTLVFDWGDTLMVNDPRYDGPMVGWPEVFAVDGAVKALTELSRSYRLVVATNAQASNSRQIRAALGRVGLAEHITEIFTMHELNSRKPQPQFFQNLERQLGQSRESLVMIGDEFAADISGASQAGWRSIWLNPLKKAAPGLLPLQDQELLSMSELPEVLRQPRLPDVPTCIRWLLGQNATANLLTHVQMVANAAYQMAVWLRQAGVMVNPVLAHRGGLLHDLAKLTAKGSPVNHGEMAGQLLDTYNEPVLANIARRHLLFNLLEDPTLHPHTWEEKLVYYADKLVESGQIVSVDVRMQALRQRYGMSGEMLEPLMPLLHQIEAEIRQPLGWDSVEFIQQLKRAYQGK